MNNADRFAWSRRLQPVTWDSQVQSTPTQFSTVLPAEAIIFTDAQHSVSSPAAPAPSQEPEQKRRRPRSVSRARKSLKIAQGEAVVDKLHATIDVFTPVEHTASCSAAKSTRRQKPNNSKKSDLPTKRLQPSDLIFDPAFDINCDECLCSTDAAWRAEQKRQGAEEYDALGSRQRREKMVAYYNRDYAASTNRQRETCNYFYNQRGWQRTSVYKIVQQYVKNGQTDRKARGPKRPPIEPYTLEQLAVKYREKVEIAGGDHTKISAVKFAADYRVEISTVNKMLEQNPNLLEARKKALHAEEMHIEAKRSLVVSKFVEFTGDYYERRNACVRYFTKAPGFCRSFVISACNKFLRRGSIWSLEKTKETDWSSKDLLCTSHVMQLMPKEVEFLDALNRVQVTSSFTAVQPQHRHTEECASEASRQAKVMVDTIAKLQLRLAQVECQLTTARSENDFLRSQQQQANSYYYS